MEFGTLVRSYPEHMQSVIALHQTVMRDIQSPFTVAERELIAAYTPALNACAFCYGSHRAVAEALGVDSELLDALVGDIESAPIGDNLKPVFRLVKKLTESPSKVSPADRSDVLAAGWAEQAIVDSCLICGMFNMMNRLVDGTGIEADASLFAGLANEQAAIDLYRMG
ncbi:peroxidase [Pseudohalioglobus sediminis]|uniref:Peroxidase n=1 Tax=Pseudohalioglobus sediminis TaxID=2606449 RepID=A0A5B0X800_9GAMM|nr:carboxymuconolactone decarboxylase family protein [Pseudohalioglobus sediminis]KAA1194339.1 peroxidase [Pseudohalioglobus sediminis]